MLPFLKRKDDVAMGGEDEPTEGPDMDDDAYGMLDAIAEDMMDAATKKDKGLMKQALEALCDYIQSEDLKQDDESI